MSDFDNPTVSPEHQILVGINELTRHTVSESRRRLARGAALDANRKGINLSRENDTLSEENRLLREKNEALNEKLGAVSALARTRFVDSEALRKTIVHLEKAWGTESPESTHREETSADLDNVHRDAYTKIWNDPDTTKKFNSEVDRFEERQKAKKRPSYGR